MMNQTVSHIWAKSSEQGAGNPVCLAEHVRDVLDVFDKIKGRVSNSLCELIRLAIVCHDWGKVLPAFQIKTLKNRTYNPPSPLINIPHSFFSLLWIDEAKLQKKLREKGVNDYQEFILSAIAYHHWREGFFELISAPNEEMVNLLEELLERSERDKLQKNLVEEAHQLCGDWHKLVAFNEEMAKGLRNGVPFSEYARPPYQLYFLPKRIGIDEEKMKDWILIAGFLQRSDHFASFCEEEGIDLSNEEPELSPIDLDTTKERVKEKIQEKVTNIDEASIWQLNKIDTYKDKNLILIAPTGYGKTEFAFLWGSGEKEKFFYTLPLRSAVNQIYERAKNIFGEDKTGLLHSDADVFLLGDGGEGQASMKAYDLARQLAFPAIISTGDQFFPYALRPPGYEKIYATFSYARLIVDEVQAYDPRAAAIVVKFMEHVVRMGGKFLLMTATLPGFVRKELRQVLGNGAFEEINLYEEKKSNFKKIKKHKIRVELIEHEGKEKKIDFSIPQEKLEEVLKQAKSGKRVLVVANTVKQAQDIFRKLQRKIEESNSGYTNLNSRLWLLHSRFSMRNREEKERVLMEQFSNPKPANECEGKILVATQVVEASLDIDADVLFTEIAPLDALIQRMGRVLRRYGPMTPSNSVTAPSEPNVFGWVFKNGLQSGRGYVYDNDLVLLTLKLLKDKSASAASADLKEWLAGKRKKVKKMSELIADVLNELFVGEQRKSRKKQSSSPSLFQGPDISMSEYDKYDLVKKLYESLPEDGSYLMKFQQTKDILDAGYMSDRKEEAHKLFREIYTISVIPSDQRDEFIEAVCQFFENYPDDKRPYTYFKQEVLSHFVVQVPLNLQQLEGRDLQPVEWWVRDLEYEGMKEAGDTERKQSLRKRLLGWCRDIYFAEFEYDSNSGILANVPWNHVEASII